MACEKLRKQSHSCELNHSIRLRGGGCCPSRPGCGAESVHLSEVRAPVESFGDWGRTFEKIGEQFKQLPSEQQRAVLTELRQLTPEQVEAAGQAASHISAVASTMASVDEADRLPAMHPDLHMPMWDYLNGLRVEQLLSHTPLIDLEYLVKLTELGGVLPAGRQNVPHAAFITAENVWRLKLWNTTRLKGSLAVLTFSYPWLDWWHPDRLGSQLRRVLPALKAMLAEAKNDSTYCTVGVMIDFLSLPQKPFNSDKDAQRFSTSLKNINSWYYHKNVYTLLITQPPPEGADYTNSRLHSQRGWCFFEKAASMAVKRGFCLLDFGKYKGAKTFTGKYVLESGSGCLGQMMAGREPPISPVVFRQRMCSGVASGELKFTATADMEFVINQYEKGFIEAINEIAARQEPVARNLEFMDLNWGDEEAAELLEALRFAAVHCTFPRGPVCVFCTDGNNFSEKRLLDLPPPSTTLAKGNGEGFDPRDVDWGVPGDARHEWVGKFFLGCPAI